MTSTLPSAATASPTAGAPPRISRGGAGGYLPHLDGLRAVAVYLVVGFHAGMDSTSGGFIGVDVFFVLSGFLVTQLLMREVADGTQRVRFGRFYARRFRRLLPASLVAIVGTCLFFPLVASPAAAADAVASVRGALLYVANWVFIGQGSDYFANDVAESPVFHFWSLSVEEQYYLVWPVLLSGMLVVGRRFGRNQFRVVQAMVGALAGASLVWALYLANADQINRAYYGTDTRGYQLLAGALLALTPGLMIRARRVRMTGVLPAVGLVGILVLATPVLDVNPIERGVLATVATLLVLAGTGAGDGVVARGLSFQPLTYLGKISYGTYLWHWIVTLALLHTLGTVGWVTASITAVVATGLAALSSQMLENPIRYSAVLDRRPRAVIVASLAASVFLAAFFVPRALDRGAAEVTVIGGTSEGAAAVPDDLDWQSVRNDRPDFPNCLHLEVERCTTVPGAGEKWVVMGDSHARMWIPALEVAAEDAGASLTPLVWPVCPWQYDLYYAIEDADERNAGCVEHKEDWYERVLPRLQPDVVFVANRSISDPNNPAAIKVMGGPVQPPGTPGHRELLETATRDSVAGLGELASQVILIEPVPVPVRGADPIDCLSESEFLDECRFVGTGDNAQETIFRTLAEEQEGVIALDLDGIACPYDPICDPVVDGLVVRRDHTHLTSRFAERTGLEVGAYLAYVRSLLDS